MSITVLKNGKRIAQYHFKRCANAKHHVRGLIQFYRALYAGTDSVITTITRGR
jgi:hypothetical protein